MVETLVACIALIPLFLLMPLVGKYIDIKLATIAASRKLAFECTVRGEVCTDLGAHSDAVDQLRSQFFRGNGNEVLANDVPDDDVSVDTQRNVLWSDRSNNPLIEHYSDIGARVEPVTFDPLGGVLTPIAAFGPKQLNFDATAGLYNARVQVDLSTSQTKSFAWQLDSMALKMQQHTAVLSDAWTATGAADVKSRVQNADKLLDTAAAVAYLPATLGLQTLGPLIETRSGDFHLHDFNPDIVPSDRLTRSN
ncbi:MAG: hypothetical protein JO142_19225 [Burkholderiales bacterium]|nr:hypothetical protein [Burkholderiales bacterium]